MGIICLILLLAFVSIYATVMTKRGGSGNSDSHTLS